MTKQQTSEWTFTEQRPDGYHETAHVRVQWTTLDLGGSAYASIAAEVDFEGGEVVWQSGTMVRRVIGLQTPGYAVQSSRDGDPDHRVELKPERTTKRAAEAFGSQTLEWALEDRRRRMREAQARRVEQALVPANDMPEPKLTKLGEKTLTAEMIGVTPESFRMALDDANDGSIESSVSAIAKRAHEYDAERLPEGSSKNEQLPNEDPTSGGEIDYLVECYLMDPPVCEALGHENPNGRHVDPTKIEPDRTPVGRSFHVVAVLGSEAVARARRLAAFAEFEGATSAKVLHCEAVTEGYERVFEIVLEDRAETRRMNPDAGELAIARLDSIMRSSRDLTESEQRLMDGNR